MRCHFLAFCLICASSTCGHAIHMYVHVDTVRKFIFMFAKFSLSNETKSVNLHVRLAMCVVHVYMWTLSDNSYIDVHRDEFIKQDKRENAHRLHVLIFLLHIEVHLLVGFVCCLCAILTVHL